MIEGLAIMGGGIVENGILRGDGVTGGIMEVLQSDKAMVETVGVVEVGLRRWLPIVPGLLRLLGIRRSTYKTLRIVDCTYLLIGLDSFGDETLSSMAPRRRPTEGVAEQVTCQEAGDALPPQQTQPLPHDAHSGIAPPPPPPQPDPDAAWAWLDAVERTFRSMECVPEERVLLASYQLQAQALTWWSAEWETTFQSRPLRQIPWQEFVVSFERAFCPTYVRTERLYQFLDLQQRDFTVVQYRARFVELGRYAPQIMADEGLRTQQFVRGLRPELRQALIVARVTDLDAAYQTAAALEADTLRTCARSVEVQTQDLGGSFGVIGGRQSRDSSRLGVFSSRQVSLRSSRPSHSPECSSSSSSRHPCSSVSRLEVLVGREVEVVLLT
ncbi:hypothetical protein Taro_054415 [Colocasia esculenta]|uniref:Retrotransposon gag domain-containing protein n=1 Tax=Colocasia esculenta TaxID=4460 RepID=A0A843XPZ4_COLES|nr:hypothetical protein [Colocasia esculenta]